MVFRKTTVQLLLFSIYLSSFFELNILFSCSSSGSLWAASSDSNISPNNLSATASTITAGSFVASAVILAATWAAPGVSFTLAALTIWDASTALPAASLAEMTTGLWRAVCKEQRLLYPDYFIHQLLLQQTCEKRLLSQD